MTYQPPPPPPGYPPQGNPQQPQQQPQPQQGYPPQAAPQTPAYWPTATQTPPQYQQGAMPPQQVPGQMPQVHTVDDTAAQAALDSAEQAAQQRKEGSNFSQFIKVPGPQGQTKWDESVPVGYEGHVDLFLLPPWVQGAVPFVEVVTHFYKSSTNPKGKVVSCSDGGSCKFCSARKAALDNPATQKSAQDWGRKRRQHVYNVFDLTAPQGHFGQDGQMRPFLLGAGPNLQTSLKRMFDTRGGISNFVNPQMGRPVRITKKKTGPEAMNVEWGAIDLDPIALDQYFWPGLNNLWDLTKEVEGSSDAAINGAIAELGWPMPDGAQAQAYSPHPQPPYPNPHGAPQAPQSGTYPPTAPPAGVPQQQQLPYPVQPQMAPQMAPQPPPPAVAAPVPPAPPAGPAGPPPGYGAPPPPPQGMMPPQGVPPPPPVNQGQPPPMSPPPVSSAPPPPPGVPPMGNGEVPY